VKFDLDEPDLIEQAIISVEDVSFGYLPGKLVLENINLTVHMDSRIGGVFREVSCISLSLFVCVCVVKGFVTLQGGKRCPVVERI